MQFEFTDPQTVFEKMIGGHFCINAFGRIEPNDDKKFSDFLVASQPPPRAEVYINSPGGDVEAAIQIGRAIRSSWFSTSVGTYVLDHQASPSFIAPRRMSPGKCMSAATLIYLGGRLRYLSEDAEFGVHQVSFQDPSPDDVGRSQILSAKIARFIADMGVSQDFLELTSSVPSSTIGLVDRSSLQALRVTTGGETEVEWTVQARGQNLYVRGERDCLFGHHKVMLCYTKGLGYLFWAVMEAQGRERELIGFRLVEIVVNGEENRIDVSDRCERVVSGIYVNVMARLSHDEAKLLAYARSFGVQIRFVSTSPTFLGIAAMSTQGGVEQLQTLFEMFAPN